MKFKSKISTFMIRRIYGIEGVLDEYKLSQIGIIGNNAFMICFSYIFISNILSLFLINYNLLDNNQILTYLIYVNLGFILIIISTFLTESSKNKHLYEIEKEFNNVTDKKKYFKKKAFKIALESALMYFIITHICFEPLDLSNVLSLTKSFLETTIFGLGMGIFFYISRLKRKNIWYI